MDGQNGMQRHIALSLLIGLLIAVSPVLAQKQQPQQPAPSPSNPQTTDTQDGGKRYGASFADNSIGSYMTTAIFPSLLHEDPRYYQLGNGRSAHRAYHASTGSLSFGPIQGTNASTSRNRLAMQWQPESPMPTMFRRIARPRETPPLLPL